jgi:hypothetical protein
VGVCGALVLSNNISHKKNEIQVFDFNAWGRGPGVYSMAHLAAAWPDQTLCKENKRRALEAQHDSWMRQREKALETQPQAKPAEAAPVATERRQDDVDDEINEAELAEMTMFIDGVGRDLEKDV